jgi:hypothetical protein
MSRYWSREEEVLYQHDAAEAAELIERNAARQRSRTVYKVHESQPRMQDRSAAMDQAGWDHWCEAHIQRALAAQQEFSEVQREVLTYLIVEIRKGYRKEWREEWREEVAAENKKLRDEFAAETKKLREEIATLRSRRTKRAPSPDILVRDTKWQELLKDDHFDA